jgi:predicted metal-dependent RNase
VKKLAPKKVVLVHGDPPAIEWMRATIARRCQIRVIVPTPGVEIEL